MWVWNEQLLGAITVHYSIWWYIPWIKHLYFLFYSPDVTCWICSAIKIELVIRVVFGYISFVFFPSNGYISMDPSKHQLFFYGNWGLYSVSLNDRRGLPVLILTLILRQLDAWICHIPTNLNWNYETAYHSLLHCCNLCPTPTRQFWPSSCQPGSKRKASQCRCSAVSFPLSGHSSSYLFFLDVYWLLSVPLCVFFKLFFCSPKLILLWFLSCL